MKKASLVLLVLGFSAPVASEPLWSPTKVGQILGCKAIAVYGQQADIVKSLDVYAKNFAGGPIGGISNFNQDKQIQSEFYELEKEQFAAMSELIGAVFEESRAEWLWNNGSCVEFYSDSVSFQS
ncbi:hypothetical protein [Vibrio sp. Vb339]|uniref:hypothetical protein n=1 Tax=Vibrio sp. Vb339 TaxID=1192013 RepID=UPI0015529183|nr:hypothetical protein [Vibrio sp. Vb339]